MDPLYSKAKALFPTASDDEITQGLSEIRQTAPDASDDEILQAAGALKASKEDGSFMKKMVEQDIKQKYGIGDRQAIVDQNAKDASGVNFQAGLAALGAGLQGGNAYQAGLAAKNQQASERNNNLLDFDKQKTQYLADRDDAASQAKLARESDPKSSESLMAQDLAISMGLNPAQAQGLTAAKFKDFSPALQKKYEVAQRALDRKETNDQRLADRRESRESRFAQQDLVRQERKERDAKPSDKQIESFTDLDNAKSDLTNIVGELGSHTNWTGPVDGRIPNILVSQDQNAWRSAVGKYKDAYRKAVTGAGASNAEIARLESRLPAETDTYETFLAKAKEAQKELDRKKEILASNLQKGGKNVTNFVESKTAQTQNVPESDTVRMRDPNGIIRPVPRSQVAAAKKAGGEIVDDAVAKKSLEDKKNGV